MERCSKVDGTESERERNVRAMKSCGRVRPADSSRREAVTVVSVSGVEAGPT